MKLDSKLIAAVKAEHARPGFKCLPQALRFALGPALRGGRESGASVVQLSVAYGLSRPTVYALLRTTGAGIFGRVRIAPQLAPTAAPSAVALIQIEDPRSGAIIRVADVETAAALLRSLRAC